MKNYLLSQPTTSTRPAPNPSGKTYSYSVYYFNEKEGYSLHRRVTKNKFIDLLCTSGFKGFKESDNSSSREYVRYVAQTMDLAAYNAEVTVNSYGTLSTDIKESY